LFQRNLLRSCHAELENRKQNGENNFKISYVNGAPQVRIAKSENLALHYYCNLVFSSFVFECFQKWSQDNVVYTDLAKVFDTVNHQVLLKVLGAFGVGEPLLSWFDSFLTNRQQGVKLFDIKPNVFSSTSGVPQGGFLSPILF
jgi:hypothetical protein